MALGGDECQAFPDLWASVDGQTDGSPIDHWPDNIAAKAKPTIEAISYRRPLRVRRSGNPSSASQSVPITRPPKSEDVKRTHRSQLPQCVNGITLESRPQRYFETVGVGLRNIHVNEPREAIASAICDRPIREQIYG
jgi:hypothetical protein